MSKIELEIFADEIIIPKDFNGQKKNFICLGCLFVPITKKELLISNLVNKRCLNDSNNNWIWSFENCPNKSKCRKDLHEMNNTEIHHVEIRSSRATSSLKNISWAWLKYLLESNKLERNEIKFNLLFIDLDKLRISNFGEEQIHENIYNKFFRTVIEYGIKTFFSDYNEVIVRNVYHDQGSVEKHTFFPKLNLVKLDSKTSKATISNTNVIFIDSNHKNYLESDISYIKESHLIQFIDLILGATCQNIYYLSNDTLKKECAMIIRPLIERLITKPYNKNSSYKYYKNCNIIFFPKHPIDESKLEIRNWLGETILIDKSDQFHREKALAMPIFDKNQGNLSNWVK